MSLEYIRVTGTELQLSAPTSGRVALNSPTGLHRQTIQNLQLTNVNTAGNVSFTAAQMLGGLITRDCNGASRSDEVDTAANIIAGIPALQNDGDTFEFRLINTSGAANTITFGTATPTGITYANAGQTLAQNESALLLLRRTSSTTVTVYIIGA